MVEIPDLLRRAPEVVFYYLLATTGLSQIVELWPEASVDERRVFQREYGALVTTTAALGYSVLTAAPIFVVLVTVSGAVLASLALHDHIDKLRDELESE